MPSNKDPKTAVNSGPGKLPAGVVPAGALLFAPGGGTDAGLQAHIINPLDAHMASAIGIHPIYAPTGQPLLSSAGGPYDGESVEDALAQISALIPVKPNALGFSNPIPNSGLPLWGTLSSKLVGGFPDPTTPTNVRWSNYIVTTATSTFSTSGVLYPADRGVLALYQSTDGDYFNSGGMTLIAALWLGSNPPGTGLAGANFLEGSRVAGQADYVASNAGVDRIGLTFRYPYLSNYAAVGAPYTDYAQNFPAFQLATYTIDPSILTLAAGSSGSFLLVHWRESFATTLAAIQPVNLTGATLVAANCYSAVPTPGPYTPTGDGFDVGAEATINRRYIFRDPDSTTLPNTPVWTSAPNGGTTVPLSGVQFYNNGGTPLTWTVDLQVDDLFLNSFLTGSVTSADVPVDFVAANDPIVLTFAGFGGTSTKVPYTDLHKAGPFGNYSATNAPQAADTAEYGNVGLVIPSPSPASPSGGYGQITAVARDTFHSVTFLDPTRYLFDSYPQSAGSLSTSTYEPFVDEHYRYDLSFNPTTSATVAIVPAGGDVFPSATPLVAGGSDIQVVGNVGLYPQTNFSTGYQPAGQPDYSAVLAGDAGNHLRRYMRAFDTGVARNTGKIRIRGLAFSTFNSAGIYTGSEVGDHPGGAIVQIKVPGAGGTGWLDIGRVKGDPDLATTDFRGCRTALLTSGPDVILSYDTTVFNSDNGSGVFLLFVRVTFIKGPGTALSVGEIEWQLP